MLIQSSRIQKLLLIMTSVAAWTRGVVSESLRSDQLPSPRMLSTSQQLPSLRLHVKTKRTSMQVFGQSEFDVLVNPVLEAGTSNVYYNGLATFTEDGVTHKYMLVDGVAYYSSKTSLAPESATCLSVNALPPLTDILSALNDATPISNVQSSEKVECPKGRLFKFSFAGDIFVLCSSTGTSGAPGFRVVSSDVDVSAEYLKEAAVIDKPQVSADQIEACGKVVSPASVSSKTLALLSGQVQEVTGAAPLTESGVSLGGSSCGCKGKRRPCLFIHGLGVKKELGLQNTFGYFEGIEKHAPCCSSIKYAVLNTVDAGWTDDKLQQKVCDFGLQMSNSSNLATKSIEDTILVAHSMGNLMLGAAIATGKCSLGKSSDWVGLSGPMKGSMGSDFLQKACSGQGNVVVSAVAKMIGQCPPNTATKALAYQSGSFSSGDLKKQYAAAEAVYTSSVSAVMCSSDNSGLLSKDQLTYLLGGLAVPHKSKENDGIVEFQSCMANLPRSQFRDDYRSKFYVTKLNHMDTTFRHGDAIFNNAQKPLKWFECLL